MAGHDLDLDAMGRHGSVKYDMARGGRSWIVLMPRLTMEPSEKHGVSRHGWGWNAVARSSVVGQHHGYNGYSSVMGCNDDSCSSGWLHMVRHGSKSSDNQSIKTQDYRIDCVERATSPSQG